VFGAGWATGEEDWAAGVEEEEMKAWGGFMAVREAMHMALEQARGEKVLGSGLEAAVAVYVSDPVLQQWLRQCNSSGNSADELRYLLIVSEVEVVGDEQAAGQGAAVTKEVEVEGVGKVTVGVRRAAGKKCARCWNYSTEVGVVDAEHAELCERCSPVVRGMGFSLPGAGAGQAAVAAAAAGEKAAAIV
jgi:isoleucyl-tRNA synthetase